MRTQTAEMIDQFSGIVVLSIGIGTAVYLIYGWRRGELRARGISRRSDGPISWWSAVSTLAIFSGLCLFGGVLLLSR